MPGRPARHDRRHRQCLCRLARIRGHGLPPALLAPGGPVRGRGRQCRLLHRAGGGRLGAACLSIEPLPQAFAALRRNIAVNEMGGRVQALNLGLASQPGVLRFTSRLDTVNHVLSKEEDHADAVEVPVRTLDEVVGDASPALLKMDVEGYETEVLAGAQRVLANPALRALILELNGSGRRYGFDEDAIRRQLRDLGFIACSYHPFERALTPRAETAVGGNTLFARDLEYVENCLRTAPAFRLLGREI
ncbi:FkbM family methyltransferase [Methylococcus capsulatus]|nr:FkbM family methyltransferase [Methylococcus capsulatus]